MPYLHQKVVSEYFCTFPNFCAPKLCSIVHYPVYSSKVVGTQHRTGQPQTKAVYVRQCRSIITSHHHNLLPPPLTTTAAASRADASAASLPRAIPGPIPVRYAIYPWIATVIQG